MKNLRAFLVVVVLGPGLAACGESSGSLVAPEHPSLDGGPTIGSGSSIPASDTTSVVAVGGGPTIGSGS